MKTFEPTGIVYDLNANGYAIFETNSLSVCEFSLSSKNPFINAIKKGYVPYYGGPGDYYYQNRDVFIHVLSGEKIKTKDVCISFGEKAYGKQVDIKRSKEITCSFSKKNGEFGLCFLKFIEQVISLQALSDSATIESVLSSKRSTLSLKSSDATGNLSRALALDWVDFKCGPTSIYHMLEFRGLLMLYPTRTPTQHINYIATYTGDGVSLSTLRDGTNAYLITAVYSQRVNSCLYSFPRIMSEINANRPLTLGITGHGMTIHGYVRTIGDHYVVYVNDSSFAH